MFTQTPPSKEFWLDGRTVELIAVDTLRNAGKMGFYYSGASRGLVVSEINAVLDGSKNLIPASRIEEVRYGVKEGDLIKNELEEIKENDSASSRDYKLENCRAGILTHFLGLAAWELAHDISYYRWRTTPETALNLSGRMADPEGIDNDTPESLLAEYNAIAAADLAQAIATYIYRSQNAYAKTDEIMREM